MSEYIEIAYAAATHRLCFLTGTGFSKAVSDGKAPSWQSLLGKVRISRSFLPKLTR